MVITLEFVRTLVVCVCVSMNPYLRLCSHCDKYPANAGYKWCQNCYNFQQKEKNLVVQPQEKIHIGHMNKAGLVSFATKHGLETKGMTVTEIASMLGKYGYTY